MSRLVTRTANPVVGIPVAATPSSTRTVHPWSWWAWAAGCGIAISLTNNPLLVVLITAAVTLVVAVRRTDEPWARSARVYAGMAFTVIIIRVFFSVFPKRPCPTGLPGFASAGRSLLKGWPPPVTTPSD